ncbi:MAG: murein L,D-transpeptidase catalytic domain family protein, partial [Odoribacter sp.]|nr:murein L,D-transpeptidase catalytic domain family protein [Odoribacter sp.]
MKRIRILILFITCAKVSISGIYLPEHSESYRLYHSLNLSETVSFPAFQEALEGYAKYREHDHHSLLVVIDFTKPSTEKRFCVVDLKQEEVLFSSYVAHGRASGENYAISFSNQPGSHKSSLGFYRTGNTYIGKNGYSLFLDGLEQGINYKARERAIVIHGADYADPSVLKKQNRLGRSLGCPA